MNILAVDIGNTHVVLGYFENDKLKRNWRLQSNSQRTVDEYALYVEALFTEFAIQKEKLDKVIICCVVPPLARVFTKLFQKYFSLEPILIDSKNFQQMQINCDDPSSVGADRLVNAFAAREMFGVPGIVVDFGTATTFDVISISGDYHGGVISPGLIVSSEALAEKAALIPSIEVSAPKSLIGKNTHDSLVSGIVYGYAGLVNSIVHGIKKELDEEAQEKTPVLKVIATGGLARLMKPYLQGIDKVVPELTLEGLKRLA